MKKSIILIGLSFFSLFSCNKDNVQPTTTTTPIVTTVPSSGGSTTGTTSTTTSKKDCEINHQGTLKVLNTSSSDFYIYIEDVYVVTSKANTVTTYTKVPAHSGLEIKALNISDNSDLRSVTMPFYDCTTTEIYIN